MVNYNNGKIYKIYSVETGLCYVGSTCQDLTERMRCHKKDYKRYKNGVSKRYFTSFKVLETNDYKIELIEKYPCNDKDELRLREGYLIKEINCVNKRIEGRTLKEYRQDNKDNINQYQKEYYQDNQKKIIEQKKEYNEANKYRIKEYQKEYQKKYQEENKYRIKEYKKQYRQKNKDKIKELDRIRFQKKKWKKKFNICLNELLTQ